MGQMAGGFVGMAVDRAGSITGGQASMLSTIQQEKGYEADVRQAKLDARQIDLQATQREADRKERLAKALASSNAMAGAKGIAGFMGSPLTIAQEDMRKEAVATERDRFEAELAAFTRKAQSRVAKEFGAGQTEIGRMMAYQQAFM